MTRAPRSCKHVTSTTVFAVANIPSVRPYACDDSSRAKKDELFGELFHVSIDVLFASLWVF